MLYIEFIKLATVDSIDWLLKVCLSEQESAYKVLEDTSLWNISEFGLDFIEVYDTINNNRVCIGRFMYTNFKPKDIEVTLFGLIVYPPYRNRGYGKIIIKWVIDNTSVTRIDTRNPFLHNILVNIGFTESHKEISQYSGLEETVFILRK